MSYIQYVASTFSWKLVLVGNKADDGSIV